MKTHFALSTLLAAVGTVTAAPKPNVILMMVDDMDFSDIRPWGGEIDTPNIDSLASSDLRFTQFHNSARCGPTRKLHILNTGGTELDDLAPKNPERVTSLSAQWQEWAKRASTYPNHPLVKPKTKSVDHHLKKPGYRVDPGGMSQVAPESDSDGEGLPDKNIPGFDKINACIADNNTSPSES